MNKRTCSLTDSQLVTSFQEGNTDALEELLSRHKGKIFSSVVYLVKDRHLAEDIFQEVFIKVIDSLRSGRYNDEGKFLPWVMRIAHNFCLDYFRKAKQPISIAGDETAVFEKIGNQGDEADKQLLHGEAADNMKQLINKLPYDQREIIVLRHYANLSFKEIAEMTNCSINTALGRIRYALMNLKKMMQETHVTMAM